MAHEKVQFTQKGTLQGRWGIIKKMKLIQFYALGFLKFIFFKSLSRG